MSRVMKPVFLTVAIAAVCTVAACASGPRTDAQRQADRETAERVEAALSADKNLYAKHIFVHVDKGVVRLTGYVWDPSDLQSATLIAEDVQGVTGVVNNLELNRNGNENGAVSR